MSPDNNGFVDTVEPRKHDDELLAAEAPEQIPAAQQQANPVDQVTEHLVTDLVTEFVVNMLEVICVQHDQRKRLVARRHAPEQLFRLQQQAASVQRFGQRVEFRQPSQAVAR